MDRDHHTRLLQCLDRPLRPGARVLDLGCGQSAAVDDYLDAGFDAWGADFEDFLGEGHERHRAIESPYRLPFPDDHFDFVFSNEVLEHALDWSSTLSELGRVLRASGDSIHVFPPLLSPLEPHIKVPLGAAIQRPSWLRLWARAGVRNEFQAELSAAETARQNERFLSTQTNYLSRRRLLRLGRGSFGTVRLVERQYLQSRPAGSSLTRAAPIAALIAPPYSGLRARVLLLSQS